MTASKTVCVIGLLFSALAIAGVAVARQQQDKPIERITPALAPGGAGAGGKAPAFPAPWKGRWTGDSRVITAVGKEIKLKMELLIGELKDGRAQWTILYDGETGKKALDYELVVRDPTKGRYAIDQKQSIEIEMTLLDGELYGLFNVQDVQTLSTYRLVGAGTADEHIDIEMVTCRTTDGKMTGGKDDAPVVQTYPPVSVQKATLRKAR